MKTFLFALPITILNLITQLTVAQETNLHVNPRWKECSFQLDPSLTQKAWRQFTREAGLVTYFRPLIDAKPMGPKKFEIALVQWATDINDMDPAWNDTFVHPDSTHWLTEGSRLAFPGITVRGGITKKLDVGFYLTKNPHANYGFWGVQFQYNLLNNIEKKWALSTRLNFTAMYGPEDLAFNVCGLDLLASKEFSVYSDWISIAPYAGLTHYLANAHETTTAVDLRDEHVTDEQAMVGAVLKVKFIRLATEYSFASKSTFSLKVGASF